MSHSENPEQAAVVTVERCVDATYNAAICAARIAGLSIVDVPRFCASASCRVLEKLIESYRDRASAPGMEDDERARRQREIHAAAADLELVLTEALAMARHIREAAPTTERTN